MKCEIKALQMSFIISQGVLIIILSSLFCSFILLKNWIWIILFCWQKIDDLRQLTSGQADLHKQEVLSDHIEKTSGPELSTYLQF